MSFNAFAKIDLGRPVYLHTSTRGYCKNHIRTKSYVTRVGNTPLVCPARVRHSEAVRFCCERSNAKSAYRRATVDEIACGISRRCPSLVRVRLPLYRNDLTPRSRSSRLDPEKGISRTEPCPPVSGLRTTLLLTLVGYRNENVRRTCAPGLPAATFHPIYSTATPLVTVRRP